MSTWAAGRAAAWRRPACWQACSRRAGLAAGLDAELDCLLDWPEHGRALRDQDASLTNEMHILLEGFCFTIHFHPQGAWTTLCGSLTHRPVPPTPTATLQKAHIHFRAKTHSTVVLICYPETCHSGRKSASHKKNEKHVPNGDGGELCTHEYSHIIFNIKY